jgi:hypothetical protein
MNDAPRTPREGALSGFMPDDPPPTVDLTVEEIVDPTTPEPQWRGLLAGASGAQLKEASRRLRLAEGAGRARLDQVEQAIREVERRHPGIGD